ncbi:unnamed protein product [Bursaphelenchus xylophilus]|uniref:(pine wood nematode) hypothetical protein n=1 Tax=Bursaphelenchus xylophilus TaxID=6326 RepID=A0A7I8WQQ0_BURXY|nr:unnamed protein product [Bursaphelenchus xylophilus]CAG9096759.1 unnamed protein product [Bursaphelenchus xylophilus]
MDFDQSERHYIGNLLDEDPSSPRKNDPAQTSATPSARSVKEYPSAVREFSSLSNGPTPLLSSSSSVLLNNNVGPSPNQSFWPEPPPPYTPPMGMASVAFGGWDGTSLYNNNGFGYTGFPHSQTPPFYQLDNKYYEQCYSSLMRPFDGVSEKFKKQQLKRFRKNRSRNNLSQGSANSAGTSDALKPLSRRSSELSIKSQIKKESKASIQSKKGPCLPQLTVKEQERPKKTVIGWNPIESDIRTIKSAPVGSSKFPDFKQEKKTETQKTSSKKKTVSKDNIVVKKVSEERKSRSSSKDSSTKEKIVKPRKSESQNSKKDGENDIDFEKLEELPIRGKFVDKSSDEIKDGYVCEKNNGLPRYFVLFITVLSNMTINLVLKQTFNIILLVLTAIYFALYSIYELFSNSIKSALKWSIIYGDLTLDYIHLWYDGYLKSDNCGTKKKYIGLEYNVPLPLSVHEAINRLCNLDRLDAFSVLGLKYSNNIGEVINTRNAIVSFLRSEKNFYPAIECAIALVNKAADSLCLLDGCKKYYDDFSKFDKNLFYEYLKLRAIVHNADYYFGCECGVAHRVYRVRGAPLRFCQKCRCFHTARNRDVWMEARMYGLSWTAYACVDNAVYDIIDWISCSHNYIKNPRINSHMTLFQLKKSDIIPPLSVMSHNGMKIISLLCPHKLPSAYCAVQKNGICLRCESCVLCHGRFKDVDLEQEPDLIMIGVFEVLSTCSNVIDYSMLERPKKAGRRR